MSEQVPTFKALADETRLRILGVLRSCPFNVHELTQILRIGQSRVSRHLKILAEAGLVESRREGMWVYYRLATSWAGRADGRRFLRILARELAAPAEDQAELEACLDRRRESAAEFFGRVADDWDAHRDSVQGPPEYLDVVVDRVAGARTVVDLGTGTGVLLARLSAGAQSVIGIDGSPEMLRRARQSVAERGLENVELRLGTLEHLPVPDRVADAVVANMVLHHVARPADALREARRALRPGGRFVVADLAAHEEESYRDELGDLWLGFERETMTGWLADADFEIEEFRELDGGAGHPAVLLVAARSGEKSSEGGGRESRSKE